MGLETRGDVEIEKGEVGEGHSRAYVRTRTTQTMVIVDLVVSGHVNSDVSAHQRTSYRCTVSPWRIVRSSPR